MFRGDSTRDTRGFSLDGLMTAPRRIPRRRLLVTSIMAAPLLAIGSLTAAALAQPAGGEDPVPAAAFRFGERAALL